MIYDVAIIGGGPGGLTSAIYALRSGFSVLLIEKMAPGGQMLLTSKIENYPGIKEIEGYELSLKMEEQARNLGCNFVYENINKLELKGKNYSMLSRSEEEEMSSVKRNIASGSETMLGKVFGYFFNE